MCGFSLHVCVQCKMMRVCAVTYTEVGHVSVYVCVCVMCVCTFLNLELFELWIE